MKFLWTSIKVENLEESIAFYSSLLGLQTLKRFPAGPGMEIAFLGNDQENETLVELLANANHPKVHHSEDISIGFAVDSLVDMLDTIKRENIPVYSGPFETPSSRFFFVKDPNGLNVQFVEQK